MWPFKRKEKIETRASGSGFTSEIIAARAAYLSGSRGIAELTGTVQAAITLWEGGLGLADVEGTTYLDRATMAQVARNLALRGESVWLIQDDSLVPAHNWDLSTRDGKPRAYRLSIPEVGGGTKRNALAAEVLHFRIGADPSAPWTGVSPLRRAQLTAGLLHTLETALCEVYEDAPLGSSVVPYPESPETDMSDIARSFRGYRGRVQVRESVNVAAAGGPAPQADWKPQDVSPDMSKTMTKETLEQARASINMAFGILPALTSNNTTGPLVREAQRHLAQWVLQPIAALIAEEATAKLGTEVTLDVMRPLQAYDVGGRARAAQGVIQALAQAKEAGVDPDLALKLVNFEQG